MRVVAKEIEMIAHFLKDGSIAPIRFKMEEDNKCEVIKIDKIVSKSNEKYCGNRMIIFDCQSVINGIEKQYQIKYDIENCKFILFKI
nr:hypothetical protein [Clostridium chromiireducens]